MIKKTGILILLLIMSCSNNDNSDNNIEDTRFKLIFDSDGSAAIIGDDSNSVIKRLYTTGGHLTSSFYFNENTNDFYFPSTSNNSNEIVFHKSNVIDALNSEEYYYQTEEIPIIISNQEHLKKAVIDDNENIYLILEDSPSPSFSDIYYRKITSNQVVESINLSTSYGITGYLDIFYLDRLNQLIILDEELNSINGLIINLNTNSIQQITLPSQLNIFNIISSNSEIYIIGRSEINFEVFEYLYDIQGNQLSTLSDFIGRSAVGFDSSDSRFEYIERGDGRNEAGIINIQTGELDKKGIIGEPGFHRSNLFFFNK